MTHHLNCSGSSNIKSGTFDASANTLTLTFHSGATHEYSGFSHNDWTAFQSSPSKGKHFAAVIKDRFKSRKV